MKKNMQIKLITLACITLGFFQHAIAQKNEETILLETITVFNQAFKESNVAKLESMIVDRYIHTNSTSKPIDKDTWLAYLHKRKEEIETGNLIVHTYDMQETNIQLYDTMAIVSAKISTSNTRNGNLNENEYRVTNIWVKEANSWKRAGFHDGKIK